MVIFVLEVGKKVVEANSKNKVKITKLMHEKCSNRLETHLNHLQIFELVW